MRQNPRFWRNKKVLLIHEIFLLIFPPFIFNKLIKTME
ncbi:hypothetical protein ATN83_3477 [Raoultella ornithinolytica]|nr:hypothetical protein ATN83_3477 [Raoultella ornithinolytica]KDV95704.1 hypothetical protein AB00_1305 [Raoultella ornithinolytica 2-156-04_S1_C1]KDX15221.1 hypothetical protein AB28_1318 [Raoultella ornithinolytica 2-156-04_S1_C2]